MKYLKIFLASVLLFIISIDVKAQTEDYANLNLEQKQLIARAYALAHPWANQNDIRAFVQQNREAFQADSPIIRAMKAYGIALYNLGVKSHVKDPIPTSIPLSKGNNVSMSLYWMGMGEDLFWLAHALPSAANGDWSYYDNQNTWLLNRKQLVAGLIVIINTGTTIEQIYYMYEHYGIRQQTENDLWKYFPLTIL